jgi:hypothetical protein
LLARGQFSQYECYAASFTTNIVELMLIICSG